MPVLWENVKIKRQPLPFLPEQQQQQQQQEKTKRKEDILESCK